MISVKCYAMNTEANQEDLGGSDESTEAVVQEEQKGDDDKSEENK